MLNRATPTSDEAIARAARVLAKGGLVALPTETVYGLGADGLSVSAVMRIFQAKGRPADHPLILHVASEHQAKALAADWPESADRLARSFWPGPMTLILKRAQVVPDAVTGGQDTVGLRIPGHPVALALLNEFSQRGSGVIAAPSANRFGGVSPTRAIDVIHGLGAYLDEEDMVLDGGACQVGVESTIVDLSGDRPRILRPGGLSRTAITAALAGDLDRSSSSENRPAAAVPRVSGSLESHYAPRARVRLVAPHEMSSVMTGLFRQQPVRRVGLMPFASQHLDDCSSESRLIVRRMPDDADRYAHALYAVMNDLDRIGVDDLLIAQPPQTAEWEAISDRLRRAAASVNDGATVGK